MIKKIVVAASTLAFLAGGMTVALAADKGPAEIVINAEGKKPAQFPHAKHQEKNECSTCHHGKDDAGKQIPYKEGQKIEKCATCHTGDALKDKVKGTTAMQRAGHGNCLACHTEKAAADATKAHLKKCTTCHKK